MNGQQTSAFTQWADRVYGSWQEYEGRVGELISARNQDIAKARRGFESAVEDIWRGFHQAVSAEWNRHYDEAGPAIEAGPTSGGGAQPPLAGPGAEQLPGQAGAPGAAQPGLTGPVPGAGGQTDLDPPAPPSPGAGSLPPPGQVIP